MVGAEAERRLASIGNDRSQWPAVAREEVTRLETKHQVKPTSCSTHSTAFQTELLRKSEQHAGCACMHAA